MFSIKADSTAEMITPNSSDPTASKKSGLMRFDFLKSFKSAGISAWQCFKRKSSRTGVQNFCVSSNPAASLGVHPEVFLPSRPRRPAKAICVLTSIPVSMSWYSARSLSLYTLLKITSLIVSTSRGLSVRLSALISAIYLPFLDRKYSLIPAVLSVSPGFL